LKAGALLSPKVLVPEKPSSPEEKDQPERQANITLILADASLVSLTPCVDYFRIVHSARER
jgi:hypothetical protein